MAGVLRFEPFTSALCFLYAVAVTVFTTANVQLDESGLMLRKNEPHRKLWLDGFNDVLELNAFPLPPDIPVKLGDTPALRAYYERAAATQNAEVISLETPVVAGLKGVRLVMRAPAKPKGFTYVASLALLFQKGSFVLKAQATEVMGRDDLRFQTDLQQPEHGLSRVRAALSRLEGSLRLNDEVLKQPAFERKPFWRFW
jgi:hypothetical protein